MWHMHDAVRAGTRRGLAHRLVERIAHRRIERIDLRPARRRLQRVDADAAIHHRVAQIGAVEAALAPALALCRCPAPARRTSSRWRSNCLRARSTVAASPSKPAISAQAFASKPRRVEIEIGETVLQPALFSEPAEGAIEARLFAASERRSIVDGNLVLRRGADGARAAREIAEQIAAIVARLRRGMHAHRRFGDDAEDAFGAEHDVVELRTGGRCRETLRCRATRAASRASRRRSQSSARP